MFHPFLTSTGDFRPHVKVNHNGSSWVDQALERAWNKSQSLETGPGLLDLLFFLLVRGFCEMSDFQRQTGFQKAFPPPAPLIVTKT